MKIGVIGVGRSGLTFALLCKKAGYDVIVSDKREDYVYNLNRHICNVYEPTIQKMLFEIEEFSATTNNIEVIENSDIIFTFVSTPPTTEGGHDTSEIFQVTNDFFTASKLDIPIFNKKFVICSTTNPGEVDQIQNKLSMFSIQVSYNPSVVDEVDTVRGMEESDLLLIGTEYQESANELIEIYNKIQTTPVHAHVMSFKAVEITKVAINSFLTTKSVFSNMIGEILTTLNLSNEISSVLNAIGGDSRIGKKYLESGFGFGGNYLPRDNRTLSKLINDLSLNLNLPKTIDEFNKQHSEFLKNFFIKQNPDKTVPFVVNQVTHNQGSEILEESQQLKLCLNLLDEGYYVNLIESDKVIQQLLGLSEQYDNRLKFYKLGTKPEGYLINL